MLQKIQQLAKDTVIYGISTMLGRFLNFLLVPFYTNLFVPSDFGVISNIYAFIAVVNIIVQLGMESTYMKFAASAEFDSDEGRTKVFTSAMQPLLISIGISSVILIAGAEEIAALLGVRDYTKLIYYTVIIIALDSLVVLPFTELRVKRKARQFALIRIGNILVNISLNILLIVGLHWGIEAVFIANIVSALFSFVFLFNIIRQRFKPSWDAPFVKRILKFGVSFIPAGIASIFMQVIDRPIVEKLAGLEVLGVYQANYRLGIIMMLFVQMFQFAWQPFFMETSREKNAKEIFSKVFTYFVSAGVLMLVFFSLFTEDFVKISINGFSIIGKAYWSGLDIVPVVLLGYLFNGFHVIFTAGLFIKEKSTSFPILMMLGAVVNVVVNILLIPYMGMMGAALATLASYVVIATGFYFTSNRIYPIKYEFGKITIIAVSLTFTAILYYTLRGMGITGIVVKILIFVLFLASQFVFGVVNYAQVKEITKAFIKSRKRINEKQ